MKRFVYTIVCCICLLKAAAQADSSLPINQIKQYWFVMLLKGENRNQDAATAAKIQAAHLANIDSLYYEGIIKVAGPFGDEGPWRGIFIMDCKTKEEVIFYLQKDPAIQTGRLRYEIHPWYTAPICSFKPGKPE